MRPVHGQVASRPLTLLFISFLNNNRIASIAPGAFTRTKYLDMLYWYQLRLVLHLI